MVPNRAEALWERVELPLWRVTRARNDAAGKLQPDGLSQPAGGHSLPKPRQSQLQGFACARPLGDWAGLLTSFTGFARALTQRFQRGSCGISFLVFEYLQAPARSQHRTGPGDLFGAIIATFDQDLR